MGVERGALSPSLPLPLPLPLPQVTPIHWGWNVVHDGWEFRSQKERGLCTQKVSSTSLAVHSMHTVPDLALEPDPEP